MTTANMAGNADLLRGNSLTHAQGRKSGCAAGRTPLGMIVLGIGLVTAPARAQVNVLTYHNDQARTGQNLQETGLTPANVNSVSFGKLLSFSVDGWVFAQPLILTGVSITGKGTRNLVFVATQHDSVYAFDADTKPGENSNPIWHVNFINPAAGITTFNTCEVGFCNDPPEIGITGTPVIDPESGTLYVVAKTKEVFQDQTNYVHRLHTLDVRTGEEKYGGPVSIELSVPGQGDGNDGAGRVPFKSFYQFQRAGLALANGVVYVTFASAGDVPPYHGWILGYDTKTLQLVKVFNDTPNGGGGGIWMSGTAPAVDSAGNLYCITGNGSFDPERGGFGDSFLKLTPSNGELSVADYFTPFNQEVLAAGDLDLGSSGALLLPDSVGSLDQPHLVFGGSKEGTLYLVDSDNMGHFNPINDAQIVQSLPKVMGSTYGAPAYFNGWVYLQGVADRLKAFAISNGRLSSQPVSETAHQCVYPSATSSISANGTNDAIVWIVQTDTFYQDAPPILRAYKAGDLTEELYNSTQADNGVPMGRAMRFTVPVIANGRVYVGSANTLTVFGLLEEPPRVTVSPLSQVAAPGASVTLQAIVSGPPPFSYQWQFEGSDLSEATSPTLILSNVTPSQTGRYTATVRNRYGTAVSSEIVVVVAAAPKLSITADRKLTLTGWGGLTYRIEYSDGSLASTDWQVLFSVSLLGYTGEAEKPFQDPLPTVPRRFYRAVAEPPDPDSGWNSLLTPALLEWPATD